MRNRTTSEIERFLERPPAAAYAEAYQILRNYEDAREIVAQAVANAWEHAAEYRGEALISTWFFRIVRNLALMERRRRRGIARRTPELARWTPQVRTPESLLLADERYRMLRRSVGVLPRELRVAIQCVYWYGMTIDAAAKRLGLSPACCKSRAWRALRFLSKRLAGVSPVRYGDNSQVRKMKALPAAGTRGNGDAGSTQKYQYCV